MSTEIERKFLLEAEPEWLAECESKRLEQGYLVVSDEDEVRLRRAGESLRMTVKRGHGMSREETEIELSPEQFDELWPLTEGRRVAKTRFLKPLGDGLTAEIDVYGEEHAGLIVVEVEFESIEECEVFEAPAWFGEDVTGDTRYANQRLALEGGTP